MRVLQGHLVSFYVLGQRYVWDHICFYAMHHHFYFAMFICSICGVLLPDSPTLRLLFWRRGSRNKHTRRVGLHCDTAYIIIYLFVWYVSNIIYYKYSLLCVTLTEYCSLFSILCSFGSLHSCGCWSLGSGRLMLASPNELVLDDTPGLDGLCPAAR